MLLLWEGTTKRVCGIERWKEDVGFFVAAVEVLEILTKDELDYRG